MVARLFFYTQTYCQVGAGLVPVKATMCVDGRAALASAEILATRRAGAAAFSVEGDAQSGVWGEPSLIGSFGLVPFAYRGR